MAARQKHGFDYQNLIIKQLKLEPDKNYIGENDAYYKEEDGKLYSVQIKFIKEGSSIDLGDYRRNKHRDKNFILIVGFWEDIPGNIADEYILYPPLEWWSELFQTDKHFDNDIYKFLKNITNDKNDDIIWKNGIEEFKKRWNTSWQAFRPVFENKWNDKYPERIIQPRFKRDHKKQKRIQCAIPNKMFFEHFVNTKW